MEIIKLSVLLRKTVRYDILKNCPIITSKFPRKNLGSAISIKHRNKKTGILHINLKDIINLITLERFCNIIKIMTKSDDSKIAQPLFFV